MIEFIIGVVIITVLIIFDFVIVTGFIILGFIVYKKRRYIFNFFKAGRYAFGVMVHWIVHGRI